MREPNYVSIAIYLHLSEFWRSGDFLVLRMLTSNLKTDKPQEDPNIRGDAFKTLIVARLSYDATEQDIESEFGRFGAIERVCLRLIEFYI